MSKLPELVIQILSFELTRDETGYLERVGEPDELSAVMGRITMKFQYLENRIEEIIITKLLKLDQDVGMIITAELSFKNKVNLLASLSHKLSVSRRFNFTPGMEEEHLKQLIKSLFRCEELRNSMIHSTIENNYHTNQITRTKITSKAKHGLRIVKQNVDIPYLFDVSDYMSQIELQMRECFFKVSSF